MAANVTGLRVVVVVVVVVVGTSESGTCGQQTPGTKRLLKHKDSRRFAKFRSSCGQLLRSSQKLEKTSFISQIRKSKLVGIMKYDHDIYEDTK